LQIKIKQTTFNGIPLQFFATQKRRDNLHSDVLTPGN